jgi:hypothetical protein
MRQVTIVTAVSAFVTQRALHQFRFQFQDELPSLKLGQKDICIQLIIFLSFWQTVGWALSPLSYVSKRSKFPSYLSLFWQLTLSPNQ